MLDFPLMLWVNFTVVDGIHPQSSKFAMGVKNKATSDSKLNDRLRSLLFHIKIPVCKMKEEGRQLMNR